MWRGSRIIQHLRRRQLARLHMLLPVALRAQSSRWVHKKGCFLACKHCRRWMWRQKGKRNCMLFLYNVMCSFVVAGCGKPLLLFCAPLPGAQVLQRDQHWHRGVLVVQLPAAAVVRSFLQGWSISTMFDALCCCSVRPWDGWVAVEAVMHVVGAQNLNANLGSVKPQEKECTLHCSTARALVWWQWGTLGTALL